MSLRQLLIKTFPNSSIPKDIHELKMGDIKEWDSMGNFFMDWITRISRGWTRCHFSQDEVSRGGLKGMILECFLRLLQKH